MKKRGAGALVLTALLTLILAMSGCRLIRVEEGGRKPLEYEVTEEKQLPDEARVLIEEKKEEDFRLTYQRGEELYLIRGYGRQMSGGYSIQVKELSMSSNGIFFETKLIGPPEGKAGGEPSYPYIAVKIKYRREPVQFL